MRRLMLLGAAALLVAGCVKHPPPEHPPYYGPTDDLPTLVNRLNERSAKVDTLWADGSFTAEIVDPETKKHTGIPSSDMTVLYTAPLDFRLRASFLSELVVDIVSNDKRYWLIQGKDVMYWGTHAAAAQGRAARLPIRPEALIEVLGVTPMPADLLRPPVPTLRFDNDGDCYVLTFQVRLPDRWAVLKEVRYDRASLQPTRVMLYDADGRSVLTATLADPKPVKGYDPPLRLASTYHLLFPETGSTADLKLSAIERTHGGFPRPGNFVFPAKPAVKKVEPLDR